MTMWTEEELTNRCSEVCAIVGVKLTVPVKINSRLSSTLGRVKYEWVNPYKETVRPTIIEFSKSFLENGSEESIDSVIKHECAHYCVTIQTDKRQGHNKIFKDMCHRLGTNNDGCHYNSLSEEEDTPNSKKYAVFCEHCGYLEGYSRMCKTLKAIDRGDCMCKRCGGRKIYYKQNW